MQGLSLNYVASAQRPQAGRSLHYLICASRIELRPGFRGAGWRCWPKFTTSFLSSSSPLSPLPFLLPPLLLSAPSLPASLPTSLLESHSPDLPTSIAGIWQTYGLKSIKNIRHCDIKMFLIGIDRLAINAHPHIVLVMGQ